MNEISSTDPHPRDHSQSRLVVLTSHPGHHLGLEFLLARVNTEMIFFEREHELDNWLRHCCDAETPVIGAVIDRTSCPLDPPNFLFDSTIARMKIPLIIVDSTYEEGDGQELGNSLHLGAPLYRTGLNLLPKLVAKINASSLK